MRSVVCWTSSARSGWCSVMRRKMSRKEARLGSVRRVGAVPRFAGSRPARRDSRVMQSRTVATRRVKIRAGSVGLLVGARAAAARGGWAACARGGGGCELRLGGRLYVWRLFGLGPVGEGFRGGGAGQVHAEVSQLGAHAHVAQGAFAGFVRLGWRDGVQVTNSRC
jgi:hypothetical protein